MLSQAPNERDQTLGKWVWAFSEKGKESLVRIGVIVARLSFEVLSKFEDKREGLVQLFRSPTFLNALEATEKWLLAPTEENLEIVGQAAEAANIEANQLAENVEEESGDSYKVVNRERALAAATSLAFVASAAAWTPEDEKHSSFDDGEIEARIAAGPAFQVAQAVISARKALVITDSEMKMYILNQLSQ